MKPKVVVHTDKTLYICDPNKNTECSKTSCYINGGPCFHTTKKEYSNENKAN